MITTGKETKHTQWKHPADIRGSAKILTLQLLSQQSGIRLCCFASSSLGLATDPLFHMIYLLLSSNMPWILKKYFLGSTHTIVYTNATCVCEFPDYFWTFFISLAVALPNRTQKKQDLMNPINTGVTLRGSKWIDWFDRTNWVEGEWVLKLLV